MPNKPRTDHPNYHHGPPPVTYDLRIIEDMASFGCTYKEIAIICGFGDDRKQRDRDHKVHHQHDLQDGKE